MIDRDEAEQLLAQDGRLRSQDGSFDQPVVRVYLDEYTGWPSFATVAATDLDREAFVALHEAELRQVDLVEVPYPASRIAGAPTVAVGEDLSIADEDALFDYYDVPIDGVLPVVEHLGSVLVPHDEDGPADVREHDVDHPDR